jgi:stromal membrane-associated protein
MSYSEDKLQKEYQKILESLLQEPHNKFCADCGASRPSWASAKLGVFICMKCAG